MSAVTTVCRHWIGSDAKGHVCGAPLDDTERLCAKHLAVEGARVAKAQQARRAQDARAEAKWRERNAPRLPQMRVHLERAEAEYARRTASVVDDRAAVGGAMHPSIQRAQAASLSDINVARVVELQLIISRLRADIARAEKVAS